MLSSVECQIREAWLSDRFIHLRKPDKQKEKINILLIYEGTRIDDCIRPNSWAQQQVSIPQQVLQVFSSTHVGHSLLAKLGFRNSFSDRHVFNIEMPLLSPWHRVFFGNQHSWKNPVFTELKVLWHFHNIP
jgi:hypothetical protein